MGWNGREPLPEQVTLTRDDLIRLVKKAIDEWATVPITEQSASDIVDEWLGGQR